MLYIWLVNEILDYLFIYLEYGIVIVFFLKLIKSNVNVEKDGVMVI